MDLGNELVELLHRNSRRGGEADPGRFRELDGGLHRFAGIRQVQNKYQIVTAQEGVGGEDFPAEFFW